MASIIALIKSNETKKEVLDINRKLTNRMDKLAIETERAIQSKQRNDYS
jgi:hypothetical protein